MAAVAGATLPGAARAESDFPTRPITMVVPLSPGTTTDIVARTIADRLTQRLGQPVLVENKQGAGGVVAARAALGADPDGYTMLMVNSQHVINPSVYKSLPYDTLHDFSGLALVGEAASVVVVPPQLGVKTLKELIALAKAKPGTLNYASSGIGSQTHLAGAYFATQAGIKVVHVPYKTSSNVVADLVTGRVQLCIVPPAFLLGPINEGKLIALATTSPDAMSVPVKAPSVSEAAIPGFDYQTWFGFVVPAKVPAAAKARLAKVLEEVASDPEVAKKLKSQGITPRALVLGDFDAYMKADMDKLTPIVKAAGVTPK